MNFSEKFKNIFFLAVVCAFVGGSVPVAAKAALEVFKPFTLVTIRFVSALIVLLPFIIKRKELNLKSIKTFFPVGLVGALNPILLFIALPYTQASVSPLIYASVPAMTAVYIYYARNERLNRTNILGIVLGLFGVALIVLLPLIEKQIALSALTGNILIFGAAIAFMAYGVMSKTKQTKLGTSPWL